MRNNITLFFIAIVGCFSCNQKEKLSEGRWIITEGIYNGKKINFSSTDLIQFSDINGNINADLKFFEDGKIKLPGINSSDIRANWKLIDKKLYLAIDTAKYNSIYKMDEEPSSLCFLVEDDPQEKIRLDSIIKLDSIKLKNWQNKNPLLTNEFKDIMKVYSSSFEIEINNDNLILVSKTTTLKAKKDRSLDKLFNGL